MHDTCIQHFLYLTIFDFSKNRFQSKFKQRTEILKSQLMPWLQKNKFDVQINEWGLDTDSFWGLKSKNKEMTELHNGRWTLLKWYTHIDIGIHATNTNDLGGDCC